ncbi:hypothetical protein F5I97DRAFT_1779599, partial [Phlebopus sp. FC_14]
LWVDDYQQFMYEFQLNIRSHDVIADTEAQLECLQMHDRQCIIKYVVEWNRHVSQVCNWRDGALYWNFYCRLLDRIKDKISYVEKLKGIYEL